jgi:hypothetical protein
MVLRLVVAVLHHMFRCTWPSSGVYDVSLLYSWRNPFRCFCCLFLHVVILCTFSFVFFCCVFVSFLILVRVFAFLPFLVVCRICLHGHLQVCDVSLLYSWRNLLRCFRCLFLHVVILCTFSSVGWVKYDVLLFIIFMLLFYSVIVYMFLLTLLPLPKP